MKIAFITEGEPSDYQLWSGTISQIYKKISARYDVVNIDVSRKKNTLDFFYRGLNRLCQILIKKKYNATYGLLNAKRESRIAQKQIDDGHFSLIFCPAKSGALAFLKTNIPIVYLTDASFAQMVDYYEHTSNLSALNIWAGNYIEKQAIQKSRKIIVASQWAKESVMKDYNCDEYKLEMICFGANVNQACASEISLKGKINLLFCGVDWKRKGGHIAIQTFIELKRRGISAYLYLVGCNPEEEIIDEDIEVVGFLNKNNEEERIKLEELYRKMHFLILPTIAECAGIVFAESSAYGVPSITYDTGGISSYVINDINGYRLPINADYNDFSDCIEKCVNNSEKYYTLRRRAAEYYRSTLNWNCWDDKFHDVIEEMGILGE